MKKIEVVTLARHWSPCEQIGPLGGSAAQRLKSRLLMKNRAVIHNFGPGELICSAGDRLKDLHLLEKGIVELGHREDDRDCTVLLLSAGDLVFPVAGLFEEPCLTFVRALTRVRTVAIAIEAVRAEAKINSSLAMDLSKAIGGQWRMAVRHILDLQCRSAPQRLANFLLRLVDESPGGISAELPFAKGALAARLGVSRETLSRAIQKIADEGLLLRGRQILVRDRSKIERFRAPRPYPGDDERSLEVHAY